MYYSLWIERALFGEASITSLALPKTLNVFYSFIKCLHSDPPPPQLFLSCSIEPLSCSECISNPPSPRKPLLESQKRGGVHSSHEDKFNSPSPRQEKKTRDQSFHTAFRLIFAKDRLYQPQYGYIYVLRQLFWECVG